MSDHPKEVDIERSRELAETVNAQSKSCWLNALIASRHVESSDDAYYVEGWAISVFGGLLEHGWLEVGERILEPTLFDNPPVRYFAGILIPVRDLGALFNSEGKVDLPLAWGDATEHGGGWGGMKNESYKRAHDRAMDHIGVDMKKVRREPSE